MAVCSSLPTPAEVHVMVAGLPRSGKSTALNNVFDLDLKAKCGARSVTELVTTRVLEKNGITLKVIDTPGLKAVDVDPRFVMKEITKCGIEKAFILLLTLSVQGGTISSDYKEIIKNLTTVFGMNIWGRCIVLLTYSDLARKPQFNSDQQTEEYLEHLTSYCELLQDILTEYKIKKKIQLFSEYKTLEQFINETLDGIVAMPVAQSPKVETKLILPHLPWSHEHKWNDIILTELAKKAGKVKLEVPNTLEVSLMYFRYGYLFHREDEILELPYQRPWDAFTGAIKGGATGLYSDVLAGACTGAVVGAVTGQTSEEIGVIKDISIPLLVQIALTNNYEAQEKEK